MLRKPRPCRVVFDGQSLVNTPPWEGDTAFNIFGWSWPRLVMTNHLGVAATDAPAIGGTSLTTLASTFATRAAPYITWPSWEPTVYVICGGTADYQEGDSGAQVYADNGAMATLARAAGAAYVIATTTFPATVISGSQETARQAGNALVLADASDHFDATINFDVDGLNNPLDASSYFDGVHIYGDLRNPLKGTGRAAAVAAPAIAAAIDAVT